MKKIKLFTLTTLAVYGSMLVLFITSVFTAQPANAATLYLDVGTGHQWDMTEQASIEVAGYTFTREYEVPSWIATVEAGIEHKGFYLQVQHVSSPETDTDYGFNAATVGYRLEIKPW